MVGKMVFQEISVQEIFVIWWMLRGQMETARKQAGLVGHTAPERRAVAWTCRPPGQWEARRLGGLVLSSSFFLFGLFVWHIFGLISREATGKSETHDLSCFVEAEWCCFWMSLTRFLCQGN